ncbi:MAG: hypothetical protein GF320_05950 [Armatimonadia bacterium]|nr:hypothetical protein [Armatimonadia bacterium]
MAMANRESDTTAVPHRELLDAITRCIEAYRSRQPAGGHYPPAAELAEEIVRIATQNALPASPRPGSDDLVASDRPVSLAALAEGLKVAADRYGDRVLLRELPGIIEDVLDAEDADRAFAEEEDTEDLEAVLRDLGA